MRLQLLLMVVVGVALAGGVGALGNLRGSASIKAMGQNSRLLSPTKSMPETTRSRAFIAIMEHARAGMRAFRPRASCMNCHSRSGKADGRD